MFDLQALLIALEFGPQAGMKLKVGWSLPHKIDTGLFPQAVLALSFRDHHVLAQVAGYHQDVIKLIPPLVLNESDVNHIVDALDSTIGSCRTFSGPVWEVGKRLSQQLFKRRVDPVKV